MCRGKGYPSLLDASIDAPLSITQTTPLNNPAAQYGRGESTTEPRAANGTAGVTPPVPTASGNLATVV